MTKTLEGGCLCGEVRYKCEQEKLFGGTVCHCRDCQFVSGGSPALVVATMEDSFELIQGELSGYTVKGSSGKDLTRKFCGKCGTPMFSELEIAPGVKVIKVGTFDDPSFFSAEMSVWTSQAQPWAHIADEIPSFDQAPG